MSVNEKERGRDRECTEESVSAKKRTVCGRRAKRLHVYFSPDPFYARTPKLPLVGDLVLSAAQDRVVLGTV